jgi:hypothetical protein
MRSCSTSCKARTWQPRTWQDGIELHWSDRTPARNPVLV